MRLNAVFWLILLGSPLLAQTAPSEDALTPRQALQKAEALFAKGHEFTSAELAALDSLRDQMANAGDDQLAELDLLRSGISAAADKRVTMQLSEDQWAADTQDWKDREASVKDAGSWRGVRNAGLVCFTLSTVATLVLAAIADRNSALLQNGFYSDYKSRESFNNGIQLAMFSSAGVAFVSLFPLLWGEARQ